MSAGGENSDLGLEVFSIISGSKTFAVQSASAEVVVEVFRRRGAKSCMTRLGIQPMLIDGRVLLLRFTSYDQ